MNVICIIPCRLKSTRLPEKMLYVINGKTLIQHTWEAASKIPYFSKVIIAVDSKRLYDHIKTFTNDCILTSNKHESGTSRLLEVYTIFKSKGLYYDLWVNWQGDEPLINSNMIFELFKGYKECYSITTLKYKIFTKEELFNPNFVKVVTNAKDAALYFSRLPIPYNGSLTNYSNLVDFQYYKHIGLYVYDKRALDKLIHVSKSHLENAENLEQLTFLYNDLDINVITTSYATRGIDSKEDVLFYKDKLLLY